MAARPLLAIFVGGKSSRMGEPKGLLPIPEGSAPILEVLVARGREAGFEVALVGDATPYADRAAGVPRIDDDPPGAGPIAGLHAVLRHAVREELGPVVAVACDMPYVSARALTSLLEHSSGAPVLAPRLAPDAPWEPMLARYDAARLVDEVDEAISRGDRSFQKLFASVEVDALPLSPEIERSLCDWDHPEDVDG